MSLRWKFILYLAVIHLLFAAIPVYALWHHRVWLFGVETLYLLSFFVAFRLFGQFYKPLNLILTGADFLKESDFTTRLVETEQPEMDRLIAVYNRMIDSLREERLRLQEQHFFLHKIIHASPSGILIFNHNEEIVLVNPGAERLLGVPKEQIIGKKLSELPPPGDALRHIPIGSSEVITLSTRQRLKCWKAEFMDQGFPCIFLLMEELTEELRRSEKDAYEKVIRIFSHEVNNSLGATTSLLHSALHYGSQLREEDRQDFETALQVAIARVDHLAGFVKSYAEVIKLPAPRRQPCDLTLLLEQIALLFAAESQRRSVTWRWDIQRIPLLSLDKAQMEQAFINIIKNALEAIGEKGTITVHISKSKKKYFVVIEDTGVGLSPEMQAHLFTPFFSTKENGQGIGLTMTQEILMRHGCSFSLESRPGEPTRFMVEFMLENV